MTQKSRRSFLTKALSLGSLVAMPLTGVFGRAIEDEEEKKPLSSLKGRKVLLTHGGWEGHEPEKFAEYMAPWLKDEGADVISSNTLDPYADKVLMSSIDLVLQTFTMSQISKEQQAGLLEAIENGTGMAGWHGGMCDSFRNNPDYQYMTGGSWAAHPGGVVDYEVKITTHRDEVTKGLRDFTMHSEQYYMHVDPNVKVLATTRFSGEVHSWIDGCVMPVTWKKMHGKGRVFYTSLGHSLKHITDQPDAVEMLKRGIRWASASKYKPVEKWLSPVYE